MLLSSPKDKCIKLRLNILPTVSNFGYCIPTLLMYFFTSVTLSSYPKITATKWDILLLNIS